MVLPETAPEVKVSLIQKSAKPREPRELLPVDGTTNSLVASAAPARLGAAADGRGREAVGQRVAHGPGRVIRACVGGASVAARFRVHVRQHAVVLVACVYWGTDGRLAGPLEGT